MGVLSPKCRRLIYACVVRAGLLHVGSPGPGFGPAASPCGVGGLNTVNSSQLLTILSVRIRPALHRHWGLRVVEPGLTPLAPGSVSKQTPFLPCTVPRVSDTAAVSTGGKPVACGCQQ